jgi:uncharacterized protein (TIGR02757 family)
MPAMKKFSTAELKSFLDEKSEQFNRPGFIENDPVCIPHMYTDKRDIEIAAFFAAVLAWGKRVTIIRKCKELMQMMDNAPYEFIRHHKKKDLGPLQNFKHRTFNGIDALYFVKALRHIYADRNSLEELFISEKSDNLEEGIINFNRVFFSLPDAPQRTKKHVSTPERKSTCKRVNMFLRWMVRADDRGVDFGIWKQIAPSQLVCPCDVHVVRVARRLKLIRRKQTDWLTALELTANLKKLDPIDPVKYDFALFGLGIEEGW